MVILGFLLEDFGNLSGLFDVTGQADYPRSKEQITDAPSKEAVRSLIVSVRVEALVERRRQNLVVDRVPSSFFPGLVNDTTCLRVDCTHEWVSRSRTAFPPAEASLEREVPLPVSSQFAPPSVRVSNIGGFSWVSAETF